MPARKRNFTPFIVPSITPRLFRVPQAAQYLGATNWFVEEQFRNRNIPFIVVGKYRVVDVRDLDAWIDAEKARQMASVPERAINIAA
jgi:excisionase family DNA binding protein